jgi:hypothetical protein
MGVEIARSSTPPFFKKKLEDSISIIFDGTENEMRDYVKEVKMESMSEPLSNIAKITGVSNLKYNLDKPMYKNGTKIAIPINSRAALIHNRVIDNNEEFKTRFNKIQEGDKIKLLYLKLPNPAKSDIIGFVDDEFAETVRDAVDYDKNIEKFFVKPLELMTEPLKWRLENATEELDEW